MLPPVNAKPVKEDNPFQPPFTKSLLNAGVAVPDMVSRAGQNHQDKRFNIYRNNVFSGLLQAMEDGYPVTRRLVGVEFFRALAFEYVKDNLPTSPVMMVYGQGFPAFLQQFKPVETLPYLPDVARLEWLYTEAFHAADSPVLTMDVVFQTAQDRLDTVILECHPAMRVLSSNFAALSVWHANRPQVTDEDCEMPECLDEGEDVLLTRPALAVALCQVLPGMLDLIALLKQGHSLGAAIRLVMAKLPDLDIQQVLTVLFDSGAITGYRFK